MAQASTFPTFLSVDFDNDTGFRDFRLGAAEAGNAVKRQFEKDMADVQGVIKNALKMPTGASGGLNLDVSSMKASAVEAARSAQALRILAKAREEDARALGDHSAATRRDIQVMQAAAIEAEQEARALATRAATYDRLQTEINRTGNQMTAFTGTNRRLADAQRQVSQASIGAGQQLQDIAISLYSGQRAGVVFAQQLPQMAFALSALEGNTNKTLGRIGAFATFLSGPWGVAIGIAAVAAGTLIAKLWEGEKAMEAMRVASDNTGAAQSALGQMFDLTTGKITSNTQALRDNIYMQMVAMQQKAIIARTEGEKALAESGRGRTSALDRFTTRAQAYATGNGGIINFAEQHLAAQEAAGRRFEGLGRGVAQGGLSREAAGKILEAQRKKLGDETYFGLQDYLNRSAEEFSAAKAARDMQAALGGKLSADLMKPAKPTKPKKGGGSDEVQKAREIEDAVGRAANAVSSLRGQFDEAPRDIDRATKAALDFDKILKEIERREKDGKRTDADKKKDEETKRLIEDAQKRLLPEFKQRPVNDRIKAADKELQVQRLLIQGRVDEADKLSLTHDLMRQVGVQTEEQLQIELRRRGITAEQLDLMYKQAEQARENDRIMARMDRGVRSSRSQIAELGRAYSSIEQSVASLPDDARGALKGLVGNLRQQVNEIIARRVTDSLFGNLFAKLEGELRGKKPIDAATTNYVESTVRANTALIDLTETFIYASSAFRGAANDNALSAGKDLANTASQILKGASKSAGDAYDPNAEIVVSGNRGKSKIDRQQQQAADAMEKSSRSLREVAKGALEGAFIGQTASSLVFGNKGSSAGSAIGGALGKFAGEALGKTIGGTLGKFAGPLGSIAGGLLGGAIGGLFKKTPKGSATITGVDGDPTYSGSGKLRAGVTGLAGGVQDQLGRIADALGGDIGGFAVSIGQRKKKFTVDPTGKGRTKGSGVQQYATEEEAVMAALRDAILDGAVRGIKAGAQRLLQSGKDLEKQLQKAADFQSVFDRLKEFRDPVGAALDTLDREFGRLKSIFAEAGASAAEYADLEALYGLERSKAIEEATSRVAGSLKDLYADLTIGDNGKSLRDRLGAAQAAYDPLKARVEAGDRSAYDAFAKAAQDLLGIQREFSGSQSPYFALLDEVTRMTKTAIDRETNIVSIATNRDTPFASNGAANQSYQPVVSAIDRTNEILVSGFRQLLAANGGSSGIRLDGFVTAPLR